MSVKAKNRLATEFNRSGYTIGKWIRDNIPNNDLTKETAVNIIKEETGLDKEDILVSEVKEVQN